MDVTDVLRDRMHEPGGFPATAAISLAVHAAIVAAVMFGPGRWLSRSAEDQPRPVMTISLGGSGYGPQGGMTSAASRPVQTTEPAPKPEAVRPPAAATPVMTIPTAKTPPKPVKAAPTPAQVDASTPDARGKTLARGDELQTGTAVATGPRGQGFGLSTGGGKGTSATLDVGNFCCPDYIVTMNQKITSNWNQRTEVPGAVVIKLTILRDGRLTDIATEQSSGYDALDLNAKRAIEVTRQLPPLPPDYPNQTLTVHLTFKYQT